MKDLKNKQNNISTTKKSLIIGGIALALIGGVGATYTISTMNKESNTVITQKDSKVVAENKTKL